MQAVQAAKSARKSSEVEVPDAHDNDRVLSELIGSMMEEQAWSQLVINDSSMVPIDFTIHYRAESHSDDAFRIFRVHLKALVGSSEFFESIHRGITPPKECDTLKALDKSDNDSEKIPVILSDSSTALLGTPDISVQELKKQIFETSQIATRRQRLFFRASPSSPGITPSAEHVELIEDWKMLRQCGISAGHRLHLVLRPPWQTANNLHEIHFVFPDRCANIFPEVLQYMYNTYNNPCHQQKFGQCSPSGLSDSDRFGNLVAAQWLVKKLRMKNLAQDVLNQIKLSMTAVNSFYFFLPSIDMEFDHILNAAEKISANNFKLVPDHILFSMPLNIFVRFLNRLDSTREVQQMKLCKAASYMWVLKRAGRLDIHNYCFLVPLVCPLDTARDKSVMLELKDTMPLLKEALEFEDQQRQDFCLQHIASNYHFFADDQGTAFNDLPIEIMIKLFSCDDLGVTHEDFVARAICKYLQGERGSKATHGEKRRLFACCRFAEMSSQMQMDFFILTQSFSLDRSFLAGLLFSQAKQLVQVIPLSDERDNLTAYQLKLRLPQNQRIPDTNIQTLRLNARTKGSLLTMSGDGTTVIKHGESGSKDSTVTGYIDITQGKVYRWTVKLLAPKESNIYFGICDKSAACSSLDSETVIAAWPLDCARYNPILERNTNGRHQLRMDHSSFSWTSSLDVDMELDWTQASGSLVAKVGNSVRGRISNIHFPVVPFFRLDSKFTAVVVEYVEIIAPSPPAKRDVQPVSGAYLRNGMGFFFQ